MRKCEFSKRMDRWTAAINYAQHQVDQGNIEQATKVLGEVIVPFLVPLWELWGKPLAIRRGWIESSEDQ